MMRFLNSKGIILTALELPSQSFRQEICTMLGCKSWFPFSLQTFYVHEFSLKWFSFSFIKYKLEILFFPDNSLKGSYKSQNLVHTDDFGLIF